jgi:hypothetical protein
VRERAPGEVAPLRLTTAGRLLAAIEDAGRVTLAELAPGVGVRPQRLAECRRGVHPLELEEQMRLAAVTLILAPEHGRPARALYAQAQAALRARSPGDHLHLTYPKEQGAR